MKLSIPWLKFTDEMIQKISQNIDFKLNESFDSRCVKSFDEVVSIECSRSILSQ